MKTPLEKTNRYLEIFWLFVTLFAIGFAVFTIVTEGWNEYTSWYLLFPVLALAMYIFRRSLRIRYERRRLEAQNSNTNKKGKPAN